MRHLALAVAASLAAAPALAQPMPDLVPAHDVSGTYLVTGQSGPRRLAVEYSAAAKVLRVAMPQGTSYILYDFATKDAKMVMPQMQRTMDYSGTASQYATMARPGGNGDDVTITQGGSHTIAGHACTDTIATDHTRNRTVTLCLTPDHVLLSLASSDGTSIVAQTVTYAPVPPADVQIPPGYTAFTMPQMPLGVGNMPASAMNGMPLAGSTP